jgi:hypothetical protein
MAKSHVMHTGFRVVGFAVAAVALLFCIVPAEVGADTYTHSLSFAEMDLEYSKVEGYDLVTIRGARFLNRPGKPRLPLVPLRIALPAGSEVGGFNPSVRGSSELQGDFVVWPAQPPQSLSATRSLEFVAPLEAVYTSDNWYPERAAELVGWGRLGGVTVCDILVYPLRYHPVSGRVVLSTEIEIEIDYSRQAHLEDRTQSDSDIVEGLVANPYGPWRLSARKMAEDSPMLLSEETATYLIVTCDSLKPFFEPLKAWKMRKGLPSDIVTVEEIAGYYGGCDLQEKIRNCIKAYNSDYGTDWVLLGGDTQVIPDRKAYVPLSDKPYLPCDLYYSDLDGTWNADGDLYWGEVPADNVDMYADVFVGRAPVSNRTEVAIFVDKVLTYEGAYGLPQDYQLDMLFAAEILWGDPDNPSDPDYTDGGFAKDLIRDAYVPARFTVHRMYESLGNLNHASATSLLDQGMNIINILGHGQYHSISVAGDALSEADFESLLNGPRYGTLYSVTCLSGGFDQSKCIGETWVLSPGGGGFFVGNSRYGWNCPGFPGEGPSDYYDQEFFESVFVTDFTNLGKAHADAKHEFVGESKSDLYMLYLMYGLNLLGDPETRIWTDRPEAMAVAFDGTVPTGSQTYAVEVTSGGSPVAGARVCVSKGTDVYAVEETDYQGQAYLFMDPACEGTLYITATKRDYLPAMGEATVTNDLPPGRPEEVWVEESVGPAALVTWSPVGDADLCAYNIYRNTCSVPESLTSVAPSETTYLDTDVVDGTLYYYWVAGVDTAGSESSLSEPCSLLVGSTVSVPEGPFAGPYISVSPNPFSRVVRLSVRGKRTSRVDADVFDVGGRWVRRVDFEEDGSGDWHGRWDAEEESGRWLPPGIYLVRFTMDEETATEKIILLR